MNLERLLIEFIRVVATRLPDDVLEALRAEMKFIEEGSRLKVHDIMLRNLEYAAENRVPICQDTGTPIFIVKLGEARPRYHELSRSIMRAVMKATEEVPLRPNAIDPFTDENSGNNIGRNIPWIDYELSENQDFTEITLFLAGGGSSLPWRSRTFKPSERMQALVDFVVEAIYEYGLNACPPLFIGIGIGANSEIAATLSRRALLKRVGERSSEERIARIEEIMLGRLNKLGIGVQGLGIGRTVLDLHIEYSFRHPTTFSVAISTSCWVFRRGTLRLYRDGGYELTTHKGVELI